MRKGLLQSHGVVWVLALACLPVAGCLSEGSASSESNETLVIYAARNENLVGPLFKQFSKSTGIDTRIRYGETAELAALLLEEGDNTHADVFYTRDPGGLGAVSRLLAPLPDNILNLVPEWARSPSANWIGASARARAIIYNINNLEENDLPGTIEGFTNPMWKGRIGWSPTSGPTQTMITAMRQLWGEDKTRQWLEGIQANDPTFYPNHTATVAGVGAGEVDVGLVNHYYLLRFLEEHGEGFPARNYFMREGGPGNLIMVVGAAILSTSQNRASSEAFLRFLLSKDAQDFLTQEAFDYPLANGVADNPLLKPLSDIKHPSLDQTLLYDIRGTETLMREVGVIP